jgi:hypothetical protein
MPEEKKGVIVLAGCSCFNAGQLGLTLLRLLTAGSPGKSLDAGEQEE